ncbi:Uu.00g059530.m01.CDS01 [Anthostomella pinea]|uniref:Uu.00g059530.m01.CDS01 n=1 Tax=Anthostomella pinea TaxID=933095 RepID=A0AAI8YM89_9PEZI|nr:Uu.00g059530.m01.CDS01 [Anthostomella pinea]
MPVPVYTDSPITAAAKPSGVTPQTAAPAGMPKQPAPTPTSATTTQQPSYPAAQPGAVPTLPTPTAAAQAYAPASNGPAPPQPGAAPVSIPPPPKAGEKYQPPQQTPAPQPATMPYPQQMSVPSPTATHPSQQRGTSTAAIPQPSPFGAQLPVGLGGQDGQSLQHPPGYHQNANASELDRYQRSAIQQSEFDGKTGEESEEGIWGTAKKWAQQTGEKLVTAEHEVWKKINKE